MQAVVGYGSLARWHVLCVPFVLDWSVLACIFPGSVLSVSLLGFLLWFREFFVFFRDDFCEVWLFIEGFFYRFLGSRAGNGDSSSIAAFVC